MSEQTEAPETAPYQPNAKQALIIYASILMGAYGPHSLQRIMFGLLEDDDFMPMARAAQLEEAMYNDPGDRGTPDGEALAEWLQGIIREGPL